MKLTHYIYISTALAMLTACSDDDDRVYTVGEADNTIVLQAGIMEGTQAKTRANEENLHVPFTSPTQLRLHFEGEWSGKDPELQEYNASCSTKDATEKLDGGEFDPKDVHPLTPLTSMVYWDNFGTADPSNKDNREKGLTVLGVAIDKEITAPAVADNEWKGGFVWSVATNGTDVLKRDLLITNNFKAGKTTGGEATGFAFDTRDSKNLLEFKHVLSKITINLTAGLGFPSSAPAGETYVGSTSNKFETDPVFTLTCNKEGETNPEYAFTKGTINISAGEIQTATTPATVIAQTIAYPEGIDNKVTVRKEALIFPQTPFAEGAVIAKVNADKNVFYITSERIRAAILEAEGSTTDYRAKSGHNYILNIIVNKTGLSLSATVAKWIDVETLEDTPKIDITTSYGDPEIADPSNAFGKDFSLYVSEKKDYVFSPETYYGETPNANGYYAENRWYNQSGESGKKLYLGDSQAPLYWPNHETYYYFRGVYPRTKNDGNNPAVTKFTASDGDHQGIAMSNDKYTKDTYPSDLMVGIPMKKQTDGSYIFDEGTKGISATEGKITLNFTYRMAQVEVHLVSSGYDAEEKPLANNIDFGEKNAEQATVKILNGYDQGYILLADGSAIGTNFADYSMNPKSSTNPGIVPTTVGGYANDFYYRHDAVLPQNLIGKDDKPLQFKITTGSSTATYDNYFINIKDINVTSINGVAQADGTKITAWEAGKHYVYTLKITKTEVKIEATITDWIPVVAGGDFWL